MDDTGPPEPPSPKLWNPDAAACWSLLFTPIFGSWLHAKNWQALGQSDSAKKSMVWVYAGFAYLIVLLFLPASLAESLGYMPGMLFLLAWYFASARGQAAYLKANNITYEKKAWKGPLAIGLVGLVAYMGIAYSTSPSATQVVESQSVSIVTDIVQNQLGGATTCKTVSLDKEVSKGSWSATAYMDDGSTLKITVELKGDQILVQIPKQ